GGGRRQTRGDQPEPRLRHEGPERRRSAIGEHLPRIALLPLGAVGGGVIRGQPPERAGPAEEGAERGHPGPAGASEDGGADERGGGGGGGGQGTQPPPEPRQQGGEQQRGQDGQEGIRVRVPGWPGTTG